MKYIDKTSIIQFQKHILDWYLINQRDLPWRKTRDPYKILVSEVMLQQTQVQRVIPKYEAWLKKFPTVQSLANATISEVLKYWSGLGYNRRALYLQKLAKEIVQKYKGQFPQDEKILQSLPGIGKYTSRALLCFAFNKQVAVVDTNVRKVILTQFQHICHCEEQSMSDEAAAERGEAILSVADKTMGLLHPSIHSGFAMTFNDKEIDQLANQLLPIGKAYEWNQALMDYSSAMLKQHKIPISKQSKFKDSDRYFRGAIIRFLLQYQKLSFIQIQRLFQKQKTVIDASRLEKILIGLQKDTLVVLDQTKKAYNLP